MARYFKAEYPDGFIQECWGIPLYGLTHNNARPICISLVPDSYVGSMDMIRAKYAVHPLIGKVVVLGEVPNE